MRVVSGIYKGRRFDIPRSFKARPTTDFAKENLFNVLSNRLDFEGGQLQALDLFAGTGSISLELLSRGCGRVVSVEKDRDHYAFICRVMKELVADPPYELTGLETLPDLVLGSGLLKPEGLFVLEHGKKNDFSTHPCYAEHRVYGSVNFTFFRHPDRQEPSE